MTDNTSQTGTNTIATDDIGGVHYQIVKNAFGALDTATLVSSANPFPTVISGVGRTTLAMTAEFTFAQTAETLLTMTFSSNGATTSTFTSRTITSGKRMRFQAVTLAVEALGSGTAPQRAYLRLRVNTAGATTTSSALQTVWSCANDPAVVKTGQTQHFDIPDGLEYLGDGTVTFGLTLETPDWVTSTATGRAKITILGYEYT